MGYLTTLTLSNDALHAFQEDPEAFGKAILDGISKANMERKEVSVPFGCYANYIHVQPSRHADDTTVYVHKGNGVVNINPFNEDFKSLVARNSDIAQSYLSEAQWFVTQGRKLIKQQQQ